MKARRITRNRQILAHHRTPQNQYFLHRADGDSRLYQMGRAVSVKARFIESAILGTVGEPINPEAWMWYHTISARKNVRSSILVADRNRRDYDFAAAGRDADRSRNGDATVSRHFDRHSNQSRKKRSRERRRLSGCHETVSSMLRTIYKDDERYKKTYWSEIPAFISRATARGATNTVISGLWAELTT
jgi:hypothetical protein